MLLMYFPIMRNFYCTTFLEQYMENRPNNKYATQAMGHTTKIQNIKHTQLAHIYTTNTF